MRKSNKSASTVKVVREPSSDSSEGDRVYLNVGRYS